jgi:BirA family transcriptional regulator, biotin operon repressor / biotin---[acetyl-CoA-carboxylase] ligase
MLGQDSLERAVRASGVAVTPVFLEETGSTNLEARALADAGAPEWTLVAAGHQTAGRGRMGRRWTSAPGRSLLFSMVLRPALPPDDATVISLLAASEMAAACGRVAHVEVASEWPNDLVAGMNRKVGGILTESAVADDAIDYLVLGIGVNVSMEPGDFPDQIRSSATSLAMEGGAADPVDILETFLSDFRDAYQPAGDGFAAAVVGRYRTMCATLGRRVRATVVDGTTVEGSAVDLDDHGGLIVETEGGRQTVSFGEIVHLD